MKKICCISLVLAFSVLYGPNGRAQESPGTAVQAITGSPLVYDVRDYGTLGDGVTLDSDAINRAIEACNVSGGGTVYLAPGTYLSGSIRLASNVALYLDSGATIVGAPNDIHAYDPPEELGFAQYQDFGHSHWHNSLIWGERLDNIAIMGPGSIDGGGMTRDNDVPVGGGNKAIALKLCNNILIKDVTIKHAGHFAILPTGCANMIIDRVSIDTNRDGINVDCCQNVRISNCTINSPWDDGICLKSSYALGFCRATENVTITNCLVSGFVEGSMLSAAFDRSFTRHEGNGGIKFGTESNGGFKNITISNCVLDSGAGFSLEIVDGGTMENVCISNISMRDVTSSPIFIRLGNRARGPENTPVGKIRNINISNVVATNAYERCGSSITGIPGHPVEDVRLSNVKIIYRGGGTQADAEIVPPEEEASYPRSDMFGTLPAYGFYCRHVEDLEFHNVEVAFIKDDLRPALVCDDVEDVELDNFEAARALANDVPIIPQNVRDLWAHDSKCFPVVEAVYDDIHVAEDAGVMPDRPFSVIAQAKAADSGLCKADLFIGPELVSTQYVWLDAGAPKKIAFTDLSVSAPGDYRVHFGKDLAGMRLPSR